MGTAQGFAIASLMRFSCILTGAAGADGIADALASSTRFPVPLYFIGGYGHGAEDQIPLLQEGSEGSAATNIEYLGRAGVRQIHGLTVAFLDGTYSKAAYSSLCKPDDQQSCRQYTQVRAFAHS